jgi:hypothetical protein
MSEETQLAVTALIVGALTVLAIIATLMVDPIHAIFALMFGGMLACVIAEIRGRASRG